ncbi:TetR/AcrR family transcriptional regulator [Kribbella sp. VKM Ac-2568]|uniref:TetR/AcrR family transcriptional regulator n=1 Tax=Kribbella sp. VKM Ac-2568 TaxID=2512219 RepID=UPI00104894C3|nr:TetR/AcrR family transcriptional regulator [Kribbella sp. VKM Ac-2568]TCM40230.1 TetR family transcriptional regulator [Kribbella sp. VKM Ac-2568]
MSQSSENVRVRRTRKLLREALVELIEERGFDRLTVGEITERAMVSRAAFYRNYRDKYQLVEQIFDEAMAALLGTMTDGAERPPLERWAAFFEHVARYERLYGALLGKKGSPWFATRMRASLATMVSEHLPPKPSGELVPTLVGAMFVQAITWWLDNGRPSTPEQLANQTAQLASAVIAEAKSWA